MMNDEQIKKYIANLRYEVRKLEEAIAEGDFEDTWFQADCVRHEAHGLVTACKEAEFYRG